MGLKVSSILISHAMHTSARMFDIQVLGATFDGASVNRRLVKLHDTSEKLIYRVSNIHAPDGRYLFFFSDPPHLIKTTQNCWTSVSNTLGKCIILYMHTVLKLIGLCSY